MTVVAAAGGEGASTVAHLVAAEIAGGSGVAVARIDDPPASARGPVVETVLDRGPHGDDRTVDPDELAVLVCAANTPAIDRARALLDGGGHQRFAALVVTARTATEERRGRVRMQNAQSADPRILLLPFDPALAAGRGSPSPTTKAVAERLRALLER